MKNVYQIINNEGAIYSRIILDSKDELLYANSLPQNKFLRLETEENMYATWAQDELSPVPSEVTRRQLFLSLLKVNPNLTRSNIRAMINTEEGLVEFDEALSFKRDHPLISQLAQAVGLNDNQVDDIFRQAASL